MIKFKNVKKWYQNGTVKAVDNISFEIQRGEFVFLTGHSGSGKTTLLKLIFKGINPDSGQIFIDNQNITSLRESKIPYLRRKIGVVFQDFKLLYNKTVYENTSYIMNVLKISKSNVKIKSEKILKELGLWYKRDVFPHMLSSGEQQRAAIARALVNEPLIILADEPTGNLDVENGKNIIELLRNLHFKGTTVIMATHNNDFTKMFNSRIISLKDGAIVEDKKNLNS
ncbi:cell division ATP-binding protein FtsE [Candidatus Dependentiae bacterium]|nr:cell division ATP-binding protein FtsE [Candidatus Dependentiae bacterium]